MQSKESIFSSHSYPFVPTEYFPNFIQLFLSCLSELLAYPMFLPINPNYTLESMMASILQPFVTALSNSTTNSSPALRRKNRRGNGDSSLGPAEIMSFVGALLGLIVVIPGLIVVCIQVRKYWQRRTGKNVTTSLPTTIIINRSRLRLLTNMFLSLGA